LRDDDTERETQEEGEEDPFYVRPPVVKVGEEQGMGMDMTSAPRDEVDERTRLLGPRAEGCSASFEASGIARTSTYVPAPTNDNDNDSGSSSPPSTSDVEPSETQTGGEKETWKHWFTRFLRGPLFEAGWKFSTLWLGFTVVLVGTIWLGLPRLDA